jgi:hypothetical protein
LKKYTRSLIGLNFLALAMCEIVAWPAGSWVNLLVPGSLISAGAALIGGDISCRMDAGRPNRMSDRHYLARRIMRQGGDTDDDWNA